MKREERRQQIVDLLVENHEVDLDSLAERFGVSKMTIHRDLDDLEKEGVLRKVRGGATVDAGTQFESDFRIRERQGHRAKLAMARRALELVEPGMTVMVNDGSMAAVLGEMLPEKRPLTLITNNVAILDRLRGENGITLISLGGAYSAKFNAYLGVVTEAALSQLRADIAFISTPAVSGNLAYHMDDNVVRAKKAMMASSQRSCLLVNHDRFGHTALHVMAELAAFDNVITDETPERSVLETFEHARVKLTIATEEQT
ncbi:DeoR/GlpR transcriptional regulator [Agrobacterium sp. CNPSo 2736]|uniref:DeoR/GlpR family DNA-binding transcription regulator n=1 Tax=Agrobacterium salinitolerans TaxID=1183413 RepID=A0A4Z1QTN4_9HYPH|nr:MULTISPECIES: DeoR/GlpR family DNA-binding transcription regulator [Agrobacterium]MDH6298089.1 DeoR/GlpR family transcriptional regulator of sugar metabolism [Agrobacterium fabrum]RVT74208.1 DeoR/GlpR transcriptional regulator [Agrobacterium sp. CNPSo 2736]UYZ11094.1 DeoR/GlpR family DNA-binding transcription regulator [Agrobacterium salinitolerans]